MGFNAGGNRRIMALQKWTNHKHVPADAAEVEPDPHGNRKQRRAFERLYGKGADWSDAIAQAEEARMWEDEDAGG